MRTFKKVVICIISAAVACTLCMTTACEEHEHTYSADWSSDEAFHWHGSACGHDEFIKDKAAHIFVNGNCSVCGYHIHTFEDKWSFDETYHWHNATCEHSNITSDKSEHTYRNGECTTCQRPLPAPIDTQLIRNGNFEFFNDSDEKTHLIYSADNWSLISTGRTNYVMSGILDTSTSGWERIAADDLADKLQYNDDLDPDDDNYKEEYVDYNGMRVRDIPYANPHLALRSNAADKEKALITNPLTHYVIENENSTEFYIIEDGQKISVYKDNNGDYYFDKNFNSPLESHVLMIHNYYNSTVDEDDSGDEATLDYDSYGTAQYYTSASTITLVPDTAAELSVWVKTESLMCNRNGAVPKGNLGGIITVRMTDGNTERSFCIKAINTNNINNNNGWLKYTFFVENNEEEKVSFIIDLGLGRAQNDNDFSETVEGYAFFDDIEVTLYENINESNAYLSAIKNSYLVEASLSEQDNYKTYSYDDYKDDLRFSNGYGRYFFINIC